MKITVSEKDDAKIWKAYYTVDEKIFFNVTIGLPTAIIVAAEGIPLIILASRVARPLSLEAYVEYIVNS